MQMRFEFMYVSMVDRADSLTSEKRTTTTAPIRQCWPQSSQHDLTELAELLFLLSLVSLFNKTA